MRWVNKDKNVPNLGTVRGKKQMNEQPPSDCPKIIKDVVLNVAMTKASLNEGSKSKYAESIDKLWRNGQNGKQVLTTIFVNSLAQ